MLLHFKLCLQIPPNNAASAAPFKVPCSSSVVQITIGSGGIICPFSDSMDNFESNYNHYSQFVDFHLNDICRAKSGRAPIVRRPAGRLPAQPTDRPAHGMCSLH